MLYVFGVAKSILKPIFFVKTIFVDKSTFKILYLKAVSYFLETFERLSFYII